MRILTVLYAIVPLLYVSCENHTIKSRLNIVLILADDLGWNDIGFHNPDIISPNIDQLARTGVALSQSYVQPLCSPSRAALMTGVYPFRLGLSHLVITNGQSVCVPLERKFLPQIFQQNGYSTHMIGKWHLGFCNWECTPTYRGFDTFYGYYQGEEDYYTKTVGTGYDFRDGKKVDRSANGTHSSYLFRERIKEIIEDHDTSNPLFLYMAFQETHSPLKAPQEYYDLYPNIENNDRRQFSGLVSSMDASVKTLVQALKDKGLYDNTLIVFSADNGGDPSSGGNNYPLRGGKATLFEGGTRAVGFVHGPMFEKVGTRYDGLMHSVDWFPTLLEAAGIDTEVPDQDGVSQWKSLLELSPSRRKEIVYNLDYSSAPIQGKSAIRDGHYKLISGFPGNFRDWYDPAKIEEYGPETKNPRQLGAKSIQEPMYGGEKEEHFNYLFNIKDDPEERNNIYDKKPEIVQRLTKKLEHYKTRYVTPNFPPDNPDSDPARWGGVWSPGWC